MRFRKSHVTLAELARIFGASEKEAGFWLRDLGYRTPQGYPTHVAVSEGFVQFLKPMTWGQKHVWHAERTVAALELNGWTPVVPPPLDLVRTSTLAGPFFVRPHPQSLHEIVGAGGEVAVWVHGDENARQVCRLLNAGHRLGVLHRPQLAPPPATVPASETAVTEPAGFVIWSAG